MWIAADCLNSACIVLKEGASSPINSFGRIALETMRMAASVEPGGACSWLGSFLFCHAIIC